MSWEDRIRTASYKSPSGRELAFQYENVSNEFDKKTSGYQFPDAEGTQIQDLGNTGKRYPLRVIFSGPDYDVDADTFDELLREVGTGILSTPIYGVVNVVPFGTISRRDALVDGANQAVFTVTFWENNLDVYPIAQINPAGQVVESVGEFNVAASEEFAESLKLETASAIADFKDTFNSTLDATESALSDIAGTVDKVQAQFDAIYDSINRSIDILVGQPLTLAFQTIQLIQSPARAASLIGARLSAYGDLLTAITKGVRNSNEFYGADLYASAYVTGSILSVVNNKFETRNDALVAADELLAQFSEFANWHDNTVDSLNLIDTGSTYQKLVDSVSIAAGFLVQISFTLKQERSIILDRRRTIVDVVGQLYGSIDDQLDFFIRSNNLTGSEIIELPAGREVLYYV